MLFRSAAAAQNPQKPQASEPSVDWNPESSNMNVVRYQRPTGYSGGEGISDANLEIPSKREQVPLESDPTKRQNDLIAQRLHESHANLLLRRRIENKGGAGATFKQDEEGLTKAYQDKTYPGVYFDQNTNTMYVKGTVDAQDWYDDFTKVPNWGDLRQSRRYKEADAAYNDLLQKGMAPSRVVGHSLGEIGRAHV